ncbi:exopolysaccharide biosynthesis polyprenyl glycosylphosphotransferase [Planktothrix sp. FACHB-1355]|uniref:Anti-sigma factor antagonist n=1 Tax=Aerosakkonema funiforme FACHB-1375 TaxID=2949571 RepID=A0A926VDW2_9CYAN|nr:exopolysaccharide biosynthesis polyprenyl glycosylphosphotransferase [Aerosakkonema funiforme FACHB-1375]MBD3560278.1 exopolysaccharide biosynthesis polyprenyl glycosylphosphotransferase [Planktothrix sp. FACHB-1355]
MPAVDFRVKFLEESPQIQAPPRLSVLEAVAFKQNFQQLCQGSPLPSQIIIDFSQTTFMDSSGLGALVSNLKTAQQQGIQLVLRNVRPQVMAVLSLTGLNQVFTIEEISEINPPTVTRRQEFQPPVTHPSVRSWLKRVIDIVGALVGLLITALLFIPIAVAIKLNSPGPIFFGQIRCGWMGKRFRMWKFRSMCVNAEALKSTVKNQISGPLFKNDRDPRITKVGRFLRRTSFDELPQFWNVLKGEMSLVGTRPPTPDEVEKYEVPEWQRLDVKPGMTGEWQVSGRSQIRSFEDVIRLDLKYQKNWSLMYDMKLILKTIVVVFLKNSGAV